jgi:hypothetical protein
MLNAEGDDSRPRELRWVGGRRWRETADPTSLHDETQNLIATNSIFGHLGLMLPSGDTNTPKPAYYSYQIFAATH